MKVHNHHTQRTPRLSFVCILHQWRGAAGVDRYSTLRTIKAPGRWASYGGILAALLVGVLRAQDFTYTNSNGTITITGYIGPGGNVTIPASIGGLAVTAIGGAAFTENTNVTAITIPDSVTNIEDNPFGAFAGAFTDCSALTNVVLGNSIVYMGSATFDGCTKLARVNIPESLTNISPLAFALCQSLTNVTLPASVTEIGRFAFISCTNLAGVYCKGDAPVAQDGEQVFENSSNVTVYYLPGTSGWGSTLGGRPTMLWNPQPQTSDGSFGVQQKQFGFNIAGTADIPLVIEATADLSATSWIPLQSCTLTNGLLYFSDPQWKNYSQRFYRIRPP